MKLWLDAVRPALTAERVWLDRSPCLLLAVCECGWRTVAEDPPAGWRAGAVHLCACHADQANARQARKNRGRLTGRNGGPSPGP